MDITWRGIIWQQFGAAVDMLENALLACPDELWSDRSQQLEFWYVVYHTLFWLDLYLSGSVEGFVPPAPFNLDELDPAGLLPEKPYTKDELQTYLDYGRQKCRATIEALTDERACQRCAFSWGEVSFLELLLYNMRHVQEHASQLNLILGQKFDAAPGWVTRAKGRISDG
ncbi:MAG: DinB family protein [Anaerolineae bacterium]|nr:DinB family protein [Anaerolineae bacterium]